MLDWTDNHEKDALDEADRPAHILCAHDGLDRRLRISFLERALDDAKECLAPIWHLDFAALDSMYFLARHSSPVCPFIRSGCAHYLMI
jgi:hypothetical protein